MVLTKAQLHVFAHLDEVRGERYGHIGTDWIVWRLNSKSVSNEINALKRRGMVKIMDGIGGYYNVSGPYRLERHEDWMIRMLEGYGNERRTASKKA